MLNLALVAVLSGSLLTGTPDGDKDKSRTKAPDAEPAATPTDVRAITNDTYAFGRPSDASPLKFWVAYAFGEAEAPFWLPNGDEVPDAQDPGDIVSQRVIVGAQINVLNFPAFKLGAGAQLVAGSNKLQFSETNPALGLDEFQSGFGLQNVKVFGSARGRVVGVHGGYYFDLADEATSPLDPDFDPDQSFPLSDERDAIFFGADFDYPSERVRLFGGIDYFARQDDQNATDGVDGNNLLWFNVGAGLRFSVFEVGAALLLQTTLVQGEAAGLTGSGGGGHAGTVAPYLKIAPPTLPVSLFVKGAVLNEYTDYGYAIGGANDIKPALGFTAGLTLGFE